MNPITALQPNFFKDFQAVRTAILSGSFTDLINPMDGVLYPAINTSIPDAVRNELVNGLQFLLRRRVQVCHLFARAMFTGMVASNKVHSDAVMGSTFASQVYLSESWPEGAGTSFWRHKEHGMLHTAKTPVQDIDCNDLAQFERIVTIQARPNLLAAHRGDVWHLAEPIGGWGQHPANARLVLTCFFNLAEAM